MARLGKISPIYKEGDSSRGSDIGSSLAKYKLTRIPGSTYGISPYREKNGEYRTGLDPDALYIARMSPKEAEMERARVKELREELEKLTGLDLSSRSPYYSDLHNRDVGESRARYVKLVDGPNIFNLDDPEDAITFAWLRVHPDIAPSYTAWKNGHRSFRCPFISQCQFFVDDADYEAEQNYTIASKVNKGIELLQMMTVERQYKVAKLLRLPVKATDKPAVIYTELDKYIKDLSVKGRKEANIENFISIAEMADENLELRYLVKEALDYQVYRTEKGGKIMEGSVLIADNEEELVQTLSLKKNQDQVLALKKKLANAKSIDT